MRAELSNVFLAAIAVPAIAAASTWARLALGAGVRRLMAL